VKEALKGMSNEMITKNEVAKANCRECTHEVHYTLEYYAKKRENGEEIVKVTVSATKIQKQDDNDNSSLAIDNKSKLLLHATTLQYQKKQLAKYTQVKRRIV
jgi:hypothetical protein